MGVCTHLMLSMANGTLVTTGMRCILLPKRWLRWICDRNDHHSIAFFFSPGRQRNISYDKLDKINRPGGGRKASHTKRLNMLKYAQICLRSDLDRQSHEPCSQFQWHEKFVYIYPRFPELFIKPQSILDRHRKTTAALFRNKTNCDFTVSVAFFYYFVAVWIEVDSFCLFRLSIRFFSLSLGHRDQRLI